jgi:hypothetical protein
MNQNKFFSSAIALLLIAFFTTSWVFPTPATKKGPIIINSVYDLGGPYPFQGTFYTHGALEIEGTVTMEVDVNPNATRIHCLYTFAAPEGTIIIRERCVFATPLQGQGRWEIVGGTGAYTNLKGNGSALMPGNEENWVGVIY